MPGQPHFCRAPLIALLIVLASPGASAAGAPGAMPPTEVSVITVAKAPLATHSQLNGRTTAYRVAEVRPRVNGIIEERLFTEGSLIQAGEVLYRIDAAVYQAAYDSARAALARSEASYDTARMKAERYAPLVKTKAISQETYDDAKAALAEARADVEVAKAALRSAKISLDYTSVTSPITGRVGRSQVTAGALVTANQDDALTTVQQLDPIYIDLSQSTAERLRMLRNSHGNLVGAKVNLTLEDGTPYPHQGELQFSEPSVDESTGTVTLRALFPNPDGMLLPGMFVTAQVSEGEIDAVLVPQQSVTHDAKGQASVMVVDAEGKVAPRPIKLGRSVDNQWVVRDGLTPGDQVIVEGLQKVRPGAEVHTVPFAASAQQ